MVQENTNQCKFYWNYQTIWTPRSVRWIDPPVSTLQRSVLGGELFLYLTNSYHRITNTSLYHQHNIFRITIGSVHFWTPYLGVYEMVSKTSQWYPSILISLENSNIISTEAEIQLPLKRSSRFQRLFPNPSWLVWGRASRHQKLAPIFPGIDSCLMVTKRDFLEMKASLWQNGKSQNVAKGWLST